MPIKLKIAAYIAVICLIVISLFTAFKITNHKLLEIELPDTGITHKNIGLLVKNSDKLSLQTAQLYQKRRNIPTENIFYLDLPNRDNITEAEFNQAYQKLQKEAGDHIQAFVATWQAPFRVNCMSITSALTFGYDKKWCQPKKKGCFQTPPSPYFNSSSSNPWQDLKIRPSMLLTGKNLAEISDLIDRGIASDTSRPQQAEAYLIHTTDTSRSSRGQLFKAFGELFPKNNLLNVNFINAENQDQSESIAFENDIMFYQTGLSTVPFINTNTYLPGAIADHLTSFGGTGLEEKGQMKAFRWLEAGATGSYGTVVEPCNFIQKFPNPFILVPRYLQGETLLEAYWKSVLQPSEGLFVGEPLAKPYGYIKVTIKGKRLRIVTNLIDLNQKYQLLAWDEDNKKFNPVTASIAVKKSLNRVIISVNHAQMTKYKIIKIPSD